MRPSLRVVAEVGSVAGRLLADAIREVAADGRCRLGLAGGSSVAPVLAWLADHLGPAELEPLVVTWVDERHDPRGVPADWRLLPPSSNLRGAWEAWFTRVPRPPARVPLDAPGTLAEARAAVERAFRALGGLDVVLLGVGPDGHVASLFPAHPALDDAGPVVAVPDSPKPPPERLTLSLEVLRGARATVLVATGAEKAPALGRALRGDEGLPLTRAAPERGAWTWVLDPAAASQLEGDHLG